MLKFAVMRRILFGIICAGFSSFVIFNNTYAHELPGDEDFDHSCGLNAYLEVNGLATAHQCDELEGLINADSDLLGAVPNTDERDIPGVIIFVSFGAGSDFKTNLDENDPTASILIQNRSNSPVTYGGPNQFLYPQKSITSGITFPIIPLQNFIDLHSSPMNNNGEISYEPVNTITIPPMNTRIIHKTVFNRNLDMSHFGPYFSRPQMVTTAMSVDVAPVTMTNIVMTIANPNITVILTTSQRNCNSDGIRGTEQNDDGICVCPDGEEILTDGIIHACAAPLPDDIADILSPDNCISAGWLWEYLADPDGNFMQCCITPIQVVGLAGTATVRAAPAAIRTDGGNAPSQVSAGDTIDACVISQHDDFDADAANAGDIPPCEDPNLFGEYGGYPQKPEGFDDRTEGNNRDRLVAQLRESGTPPSIMYVNNNITLAISPYMYMPPSGDGSNTGSTNTGGGSGGGGGGGAGIAIGAVAVIGGLAWLLWDGNPAAFTFSPQHSFSFNNESGYALHYGSRLKFNQDNWHLYWTASQNNRQGDFSQIRYGTGAKYDAGFWAADFNNSAYGENTRMDFALKANAEFGLWTISPQYRADYASNKNGEEWISHALLAAGEWRRDRWTLTPSAGLNWNAFDEFGDNVRAKVLIVRDL